MTTTQELATMTTTAATVAAIMARPGFRHHNVRAVADALDLSLAQAVRLTRGPQFRYVGGGRTEVEVYTLDAGQVVRHVGPVA
jgi:hypothetical protein